MIVENLEADYANNKVSGCVVFIPGIVNCLKMSNPAWFWMKLLELRPIFGQVRYNGSPELEIPWRDNHQIGTDPCIVILFSFALYLRGFTQRSIRDLWDSLGSVHRPRLSWLENPLSLPEVDRT